MPALHDLQDAFLQAMFGTEAPGLLATVMGDGLPPASRLQIYRHHVLTTLTDALQATFPVICRLVDERFFRYAADAYLRQHPPEAPCLFEFGQHFPAFLATFPPCRHLAYLEDVARLEWALNAALHAEVQTPLDPATLGAVAPADVPRLVLQFDPSVRVLTSPWPLDTIWRAQQAEADPETLVDLHAGGVCLEVRRWDDTVGFRRLDPTLATFRTLLAAGQTLERAATDTLAVDPAFDCVAALQALLADDVLSGFTCAPDTKEDSL